MNEEKSQLYSEDSTEGIVKRYEDMIKNNKQCFFDVHEFEDIIDYYLDINEFNHAAQAVDIAVKQHPDAATLQLKSVQILIDEGKPFQALKILNKIEQIETDNEEVYILKAFALNQLGNVKEAVRQFDIALTLLTEVEEKIELLQNIGISFQNMIKYKLAIKYFKMAYELDRNNLTSIYDLANCYDRNNEFRKSIKLYNEYLDKDPFSEMVWYKIGGVYEKIENFDKAIEAYDFALAIDDEYTLVYLSKANVLIQKGDFTSAINVYEEFISKEDSYVDAYCNIGICYEELQNPQKAMEYYLKAIKIDPEYPDAWFNIADLMIRQGELKESLPYFKKALELDEENDAFWMIYAQVLSKLEKFREAEKAFSQAIEIEPFDYIYWLKYAEHCYESGQFEKAYNILTDSYQYHADIAEINYYLAAYSMKVEQTKEALVYFENGLKQDFTLYHFILDEFQYLKNNKEIKKIINKYRYAKL